MSSHSGPIAMAQLGEIFERELRALGGTVKDTYQDRELLITRGILNVATEVQPRDRIFSGVAARFETARAAIHPYTFRQVCSNGAILVSAVGTLEIDLSEFENPFEAEEAIVSAIHQCADPEVFQNIGGRLRAALDEPANAMLTLMPLLSRFPREVGRHLAQRIAGQLRVERDGSRYGLFNAVTAVARTTRDPRRRWDLEELGGCIALIEPRSPIDSRSVCDRLVTA